MDKRLERESKFALKPTYSRPFTLDSVAKLLEGRKENSLKFYDYPFVLKESRPLTEKEEQKLNNALDELKKLMQEYDVKIVSLPSSSL